VLVHEFGHFITAKKTGVRVEEFGLGLPPRAFGKKFGDTIYSLNWLPFGGFVKLTGEDFDATDDPVPSTDPRNFKSKTPWQRGLILVAGVVMNILTAVTLYYMMFGLTGFRTMTLPLFFDHDFRYGHMDKVSTVITDYADDSVAEIAGMEVGEAIIEVAGQPVYSASDIRTSLEDKEGQSISVLLMDVRGLERDFRTVEVTPYADGEGVVLFGVYLTDAFNLDYSTSGYDKTRAGFFHAYNMLTYSASTLWNLSAMAVEEGDISPVSNSVSGPVGISHAVSGVLSFKGKEAVIGLIDLTALLSVSLALLNMLPFPALDGGRLVFVIFELISGKKVNEKLEGNIHKFGMLFLLALLVLVTIKDVRGLF